MAGLGTDHHLYEEKSKISVTDESDRALQPIYVYVRICLSPAVSKGIQYKKSEL